MFKILILLSLLLTWEGSALAGDCVTQYFLSLKVKSASDCETSHSLSTGSGTVSPSVLALIGENPAGLAFNKIPKGHIAFSRQAVETSLRPNFLSAAGTGTVGGGIGYHSVGDGNKETTVFRGGFGVKSDRLKTAIGISGNLTSASYTSAYPETASSFSVGLLINPAGRTRLGVTAHDPGQSNSLYSLGFSLPFSRYAILVVDGIGKGGTKYGKTEFGISKALIRPAIGFNLTKFQFSLGYNATVNSSIDDWSKSKYTGGLTFWLDSKLRLVSYFNRLEWFYLGFTSDIAGGSLTGRR